MGEHQCPYLGCQASCQQPRGLADRPRPAARGRFLLHLRNHVASLAIPVAPSSFAGRHLLHAPHQSDDKLPHLPSLVGQADSRTPLQHCRPPACAPPARLAHLSGPPPCLPFQSPFCGWIHLPEQAQLWCLRVPLDDRTGLSPQQWVSLAISLTLGVSVLYARPRGLAMSRPRRSPRSPQALA